MTRVARPTLPFHRAVAFHVQSGVAPPPIFPLIVGFPEERFLLSNRLPPSRPSAVAWPTPPAGRSVALPSPPWASLPGAWLDC